ncbi:hypothetical protein F4780DRAFT_635950 [Xylariomycetidae sp. FL0641]|nr:hypothetical protein F4780DRAFT_635950 [Xylariomycetidae sp. FL0641]
MYRTLVLLSTTALAAAAQRVPALAQRDVFLQARQDNGAVAGDISDECQAALASVAPMYTELPLPPPDLLSQITTMTLPADPCATPSFTGQASSEYASYTAEVVGWYASHSAELASALSACPQLESYANAVPVCSTAAGMSGVTAAGAGGAGPTTSGAMPMPTSGATDASASMMASDMGGHHSSMDASATGKPSATSSVVTPNAAPRETGFVMAAGVAAAGFMAAVAAM